MVKVYLLGIDEFLSEDVEKRIRQPLKRLLKVDDKELFIFGFNSKILLDGIDQTSFHCFIKIELDSKYKHLEREVSEYLLEALSDFSIHTYLEFNYIDSKVYSRFDKEYPDFVKESNQAFVSVKGDDESEEDDFVDIFKSYENKD